MQSGIDVAHPVLRPKHRFIGYWSKAMVAISCCLYSSKLSIIYMFVHFSVLFGIIFWLGFVSFTEELFTIPCSTCSIYLSFTCHLHLRWRMNQLATKTMTLWHYSDIHTAQFHYSNKRHHGYKSLPQKKYIPGHCTYSLLPYKIFKLWNFEYYQKASSPSYVQRFWFVMVFLNLSKDG